MADGSFVVHQRSDCIAVRVSERFSTSISNNINSEPGVYHAMLRVMDMSEVTPSINRVFQTLSRKVLNEDGSWGEKPKFPIVNYIQKMEDLRQQPGVVEGVVTEISEVSDIVRKNRQFLFSDKGVYFAAPHENLLPFKRATSPGANQWTAPRSL
jgi:hypothetical protein